MVSAPLKAGGCSWRIHYYPNGVSSSSKDYISIFVALDSKVSEPVKVWSRFTLLDHAGELVPAGTTGNGRFANSAKLLAKAFPTGLARSCWESTVGV
jgi:hypothetical protein